MKRLLTLALVSLMTSPALPGDEKSAPEKYDLSKTGIEWHKGIDAVKNQGKPILLLQILGNYDEVFC